MSKTPTSQITKVNTPSNTTASTKAVVIKVPCLTNQGGDEVNVVLIQGIIN